MNTPNSPAAPRQEPPQEGEAPEKLTTFTAFTRSGLPTMPCVDAEVAYAILRERDEARRDLAEEKKMHDECAEDQIATFKKMVARGDKIRELKAEIVLLKANNAHQVRLAGVAAIEAAIKYTHAGMHEEAGMAKQDFGQDGTIKEFEAMRAKLQTVPPAAPVEAQGGELENLRAKVDYMHKMGLRFGMMKSSDKPEPYLMHTWTEDSDHERMFREWSDSIGWQDEVAKLKAQLSRPVAPVGELPIRKSAVDAINSVGEGDSFPLPDKTTGGPIHPLPGTVFGCPSPEPASVGVGRGESDKMRAALESIARAPAFDANTQSLVQLAQRTLREISP